MMEKDSDRQKSKLVSARQPVHVVYGGADRFSADTPQKLGKIALSFLENYAPDFSDFADIFNLTETLKSGDFSLQIAQAVYERTIEKLKREPVEDFRIDFEDGYGFRSNAEEDAHAVSASDALAESFKEKKITPFCGFRVKSFQTETFKRAKQTLDIFLNNLFEKTDGNLPENFVVTLPKIINPSEVENLAEILVKFEKKNNLSPNSIAVEIMIETPQAIFNERGEANLRKLVEAGKGRVNSAHFGAYDYTASFGISGTYQDLRHESCNFARQMMQIMLSPLQIRLSDSVTTEMPVPVYKGDNLTKAQISENRVAVESAWLKHFENVTFSLSNGFYQSWDLHPAQLVARFAAVYAFYLKNADTQAARLKGFINKATQANLTRNIFDDAASAQGLLNFFISAFNSGAMTGEEISRITELSTDELKSASFPGIIKNRNPKFN